MSFFKVKVILFTYIVCYSSLQAHTNTLSLSEEKKIALERFFQLLMQEYEFGYTLFGSKPLSMALYTDSLEQAVQTHILEKGWDCWQEVESKLSSQNFCLIKQQFQDPNQFLITLVNRKAAEYVIEQNLELFQNVFGKLSPQAILKIILQNDRPLFEINDPPPQALIGILLGYGKENSQQFEKEGNLFRYLRGLISPPFSNQDITKSLPPLGQLFLKYYSGEERHPNRDAILMQTALHEASQSCLNRQYFALRGSDFYLDRFCTPRFTFWQGNQETALLEMDYEKTRTKLRKVFKEQPFLDKLFDQWNRPQDDL